MISFELPEVRRFTDALDARMNECDNGEGMDCANLDGSLRHYAGLCFEFCENVRQWGRAVFYGQVAFDSAVEELWLDEGVELYRRASQLWSYGQNQQGECFILDNGAALGSSLWQLERLLRGWVSPKPATSSLARNGVTGTPAAKEQIQKNIDALQPLPADWQPIDPRRRPLFNKVRNRRNP